MVKCSGGFTSGDFKCIKDFEGEVPGRKTNKSMRGRKCITFTE